MKRDMDYIRELLLEIEEAPAEELWSREAANPTPDLPRLSQHLKLLQDAGLIDAEEHTVYLGGGELWYGVRLTWAGHEFLDTIRSETVWTETKRRVTSTVGTVSIAVLSEVAKQVAKGFLGLP